jgi:hypothetical protein
MGTGLVARRRAFLARFRVLIREYLGFQRAVSEDLGPQYFGCPGGECTAPGADKVNGCPKCLWKIKWKAFESRTRKAFAKLRDKKPTDNRDWPLSRLMFYLTTVMRAAGSTRRGYHYSWTVLMSKLVDIYRDETSRVSAIDSWNQRQQMKAFLDEFKSRGSRPYEDESGVE